MDFIPERSELQVDSIDVKDPVVKKLIKDLGIQRQIPNFKKGRD